MSSCVRLKHPGADALAGTGEAIKKLYDFVTQEFPNARDIQLLLQRNNDVDEICVFFFFFFLPRGPSQFGIMNIRVAARHFTFVMWNTAAFSKK